MTTTAIPQVRYATLEDYHPLLSWLNSIFQPKIPNFFQNHYGHVFHSPESITHTSLILEENQQYIGHITLLPLEIKTSIGRLRVGAIGQVAVDPSSRGRGLLHVLIESAHREALVKGCVLGFLGGVRSLYSRFGYEICGIHYEWMWDRRRRKRHRDSRLMDSSDTTDILYDYWNRKPYGVCWERDKFNKVLQRPLLDRWMSPFHTYALVRKETPRILVDCFLGNIEEFQPMMDSLCEYYSTGIYIRHSAGNTIWQQWMESNGMDITRKANGMLKILDSNRLLQICSQRAPGHSQVLEELAGSEFSEDSRFIDQQRLAVRKLFGDPFDQFPNSNPISWEWESISYV